MNVEMIIRRHYGAVLSILIYKFSDIDLAENALQEACIKAMHNWPAGNIENPAGWLVTVSSRIVLDELRRQQRAPSTTVTDDIPLTQPEFSLQLEDKALQLLFMCCHPALAPNQQVALALKMVMGFSTDEIAKAFLIPERTLEQRITRAKRKLVVSGVDLSLPSSAYLQQRLPSVQHTLYLIFNEGYQSANGPFLFDKLLCEQAIKLTRSLSRLYRQQAASLALLALMLFQHARHPARDKEQVITLEAQNRKVWNKECIREADVLLQKSLKLGWVDRYSIEAAIAGVHSLSPSYAETDWQELTGLYRKLIQYNPSPVVCLNLAVAHMMLENWGEAAELIERIEGQLPEYAPFYLAKARLMRGMGNVQARRAALEKALSCSHNPVEHDYVEAQLNCMA